MSLRKMALVPYDSVNTLARLQLQKPDNLDPNLHAMSRVEQEMMDILKNPNLSAQTKLSMYHNLFHRYANISKQYGHVEPAVPPPPPRSAGSGSSGAFGATRAVCTSAATWTRATATASYSTTGTWVCAATTTTTSSTCGPSGGWSGASTVTTDASSSTKTTFAKAADKQVSK